MPKATKNKGVQYENYSNKVFEALRCLEEPARKRLLKYLRSPYFVQSKSMEVLGAFLLHEIAKGKTGFNRNHIWRQLHPNEPYEDVNFRKYCSDLSKLVQDFMAHESIAEDPLNSSVETLKYAVENKILPFYSAAIRNAREQIEKPAYRSPQHFRAGYLMEYQYFSMMDFGEQFEKRANLEDISTHLDHLYWIEKLKLGRSALSHQKRGTHQYELHFIPEILQHLNDMAIDELPELAIHYYSFQTLNEEDNLEHYFHLKKLLEEYAHLMPQADAIDLIDAALQYCTRKINQGMTEFSQEYFDVFEEAMKNKVFLIKGELATWRFNNMVAAALRLGKLEWAEQFIKNNHHYLPAESRSNTFSFNLARVYRFQGKFEEVLGLLRDVEYQDIGYNLISKTILTITYYELGQLDVLGSFLSAFRLFLDRNKKVPYKDLQVNLIKYTRRLIRLTPGDKAKIERLKEEITREKSRIINHEWLLAKLSEM